MYFKTDPQTDRHPDNTEVTLYAHFEGRGKHSCKTLKL